MALTNTRLTDTEPTTVFAAVGQQAITTIHICNTTATNATVNVFAVNSDDSTGAGEDNQIYSALEINGNDTYVISTEKMILDDSDLIEVEANISNAITVTVSSIAV